MYHSLTIGGKNTWNDWHLIPTSRPLVNPPKVKTSLIDVPGSDGIIDLTESLTGRPTFDNRTGSWTFVADNDFMEWSTLYSDIMNYLHGRRMRVVLEDDPGYYYEGRFSVNAWKSDSYRSSIVIDYDVGPYKKGIYTSGSDWEWDTFNFETSVIQDYTNMVVDGTLSVTVIADTMESVPLITASTAMTVTFGGTTYNLVSGANVIEDIVLQNGNNPFVFTGNGFVTIEFEGGRL